MTFEVAPSQLILDKAEQLIAGYGSGHPSDNYLSRAYGFTVTTPPLLTLPESHSVWDEFAAELPDWVNLGINRERIEKIPLLDASEASLPAKYLSRAITILTILSHAYYAGDFMSGAKIITSLPSFLLEPLQTLAKRMGRDHIGYTVYEGYLYNWKFKNPDSGLKLAENMELLVPLTGTREESISHMVLTEVEIKAAPLILFMVNAQNAVVQNNKAELEKALSGIIDTLMDIWAAFMKINLIPGAETYLQPIIWSKTAAIISAQYTKYELGMSGASSPSINLIDEFLGRKIYQSEMGQQELSRRKLLPKIHQEFIDAISKVSVSDYIHKINDKNLLDLWAQVNDKFSGKKGFLEIHKRKIFNYIQMGMKSGRITTNAGYTATSDGAEYTTPWDIINHELELGRLERYYLQPQILQNAHIKNVTTINDEVTLIDFILESNTIYYIGDRCNIYIENTDEIVKKTLNSLCASEDSKIELSNNWVDYLSQRLQKPIEKIIYLSEFLTYAKIRPLTREIAQIFYRLTANKTIKYILDYHLEDQFELWDFLDVLQKELYDVTRLWKISPWQRENLSKILPPELPRSYSIASAPRKRDSQEGNRFSIISKRLKYETNFENNKQYRLGSGSNFLKNLNRLLHKTVQLSIESPLFFPLKDLDQNTNFFFAGGVGVSTFMSALGQIKANNKNTYLFFSVHDINSFLYMDQLIEYAKNKNIIIHVAITSESYAQITDEQKKIFSNSSINLYFKKKIEHILLKREISDSIFSHLYNNKTFKTGSKFFICGRTSFCNMIEDNLQLICEKKLNKEESRELILKNIANKCLSDDVYTGYFPKFTPLTSSLKEIPISTVSQYNHPKKGYWLIIDDLVYDIGAYAAKHPGGDQILFSCSGLDATKNFRKVEHHLSTEIESLLSFFKIGQIKKLNFDSSNYYVFISEKLGTITQQDLYENWVQFLFEIVEIENRLSLAFSPFATKQEPTTALLAKIILNGHNALSHDLLGNLSQEILPEIWIKTLAVYGENEKIFSIKNSFLNQDSKDKSQQKMLAYINRNKNRPVLIENYIKTIIKFDQDFVLKLKKPLIKIHLLFESNTSNKALGKKLIKTLINLAKLVHDYHSNFDKMVASIIAS
jgi:sulfite reductase (NADPH) flavoprotein alpha-component